MWPQMLVWYAYKFKISVTSAVDFKSSVNDLGLLLFLNLLLETKAVN